MKILESEVADQRSKIEFLLKSLIEVEQAVGSQLHGLILLLTVKWYKYRES